MTDLEKFLSFGNLNNIDDIQSHFYEVSHKLFSGYLLQTKNDEQFYITDLELYLYNKDSIQDPFMTARHHTQLTSGHFYVHRSKKNHKEFKQPNFIGLDITCGSPFDCYGGLLIRAIKNKKTGEEINGCAKVLNYLVSGRENGKLISKKWSEEEILSLQHIDDNGIENCSLINLAESSSIPMNEIFVAHREHGQKVNDESTKQFNNLKWKTISPLTDKISKFYESISVNPLKIKTAA